MNHREQKRHQKVIETESGEPVGYARWLLPPVLAEKNVWPEAGVAEPTKRNVNYLRRTVEQWKKMAAYLEQRPMESLDVSVNQLKKLGPELWVTNLI